MGKASIWREQKRAHASVYTPLPASGRLESVVAPGVALISVLALGMWVMWFGLGGWSSHCLSSLFAAAMYLLVTFVIFKLWFLTTC